MASPTLTLLSSDNFQRANAYPLSGLWAVEGSGQTGLEIISDAAGVPTTGSPFPFFEAGGEIYQYSLQNDQFCSATINSAFIAAQGGISLFCRYTFQNEGILSDASYELTISVQAGAVGDWSLRADDSIISSGSVSLSAGDIITLSCVGTTIYFLHGATVVSSVTNTTIASGNSFSTGLWMENVNGSYFLDGFVTLFAVGSASVSGGGGGGSTPGTSTTFLGSVRVVTQAPAGQTVKFIGTVTKVASVPSGASNPYLGNVIAGTPSSNDGNPALGEVVEVTQAPSGVPDPFLGSMEGL